MNKKKYVVAVVEGLTTKDLDKELSAPTGSSTVPNRAVELYDPRHENPRMTDWLLTDEEAANLRKDERVFFVNPKCTSAMSIYSNDIDKTQYAQFWMYDTHDHLPNPNSFAGLNYTNDICTKGDIRNAGLYMHSQQDRTNIDPLNTHEGIHDNVLQNSTEGLENGKYDFGQGEVDVNDYVQGYNAVLRVNGTNTHRWEYDGEGVDWVCIDSGIYASHPEFADEDGNTRVQKIDWYTEAVSPDDYATHSDYINARNAAGTGVNGESRLDINCYENDEESGLHGTHVTSIACGKKHGWAKKADIYVCAYPWLENDRVLAGEEVSVSEQIAKAFDLVLAWHKNKTNGRPTVLNLSIGLNYIKQSVIWDHIKYRDEIIENPLISGEADLTAWANDDYLRTLDGELWLPKSSGEYAAKRAEIEADDYDGPWEDVGEYFADFYFNNTIQGVEWAKVHRVPMDNKFGWNYGLDGSEVYGGLKLTETAIAEHSEWLLDENGHPVFDENGDRVKTVHGEWALLGGYKYWRGNWATDVDTGIIDGADIQLAYEQMIQEGIHVVSAADNSNQFHAVENPEDMKCDYFGHSDKGHLDWNNYFDIVNDTNVDYDSVSDDYSPSYRRTQVDYNKPHRRYYPQRPPIPYHKDAFNVGSLGTRQYSESYNNLTHTYMKSAFSSYGPAVNIWACGEDIIAAAGVKRHNSWHPVFTPYETDVEKYPELEGYYSFVQSGTSMATPQVSGILCQYLQKYPNKSPSEIRHLMLKDSKPARHIQKGYVAGESGSFNWHKFHDSRLDQGYIEKHSPYDVYMYYEAPDGGADDPTSWGNQNGAGPLNVVMSPYSGTGSLTIENSDDKYDSYTGQEKRLHLISGDVFNNAELRYGLNDERIKLTFYNEDGAVSPIPNLPVTLKVKNLSNGEINHYKNKFGSDGYIITDDLNLDLDNVGYEVTADVVGNYFTDSPLLIGDATKVISPDLVTIADGTVTGTVVYEVVTSHHDDVIELDASSSPHVQLNTSTGVITLSEDADLDIRNEYSFTINATRLGGTNTTSKTIKIVVQSNEVVGAYISGTNVNIGVNTNNGKIHHGEVRDFKNEIIGVNVLYDQDFDYTVQDIVSVYIGGLAENPSTTVEIIKSEAVDAAFDVYGSGTIYIKSLDFSNLTSHDFNIIIKLTDDQGNTKEFFVNLTVNDGSVPLWRANIIDPIDLTDGVDYGDTVICEKYSTGTNGYEIVNYEMCDSSGEIINDEYFYVDTVERLLEDGSPVTSALVRLKKPVDYEDGRLDSSDDSYKYNLLATQSNGGSSVFPISHTIIDVLDTIDIGLEFESSYEIDYGFIQVLNLDEDLATGTVVGTVSVTNFNEELDEDLLLVTPTLTGVNIDPLPMSLVKDDTYDNTWNVVLDAPLDYESASTFGVKARIEYINPLSGEAESSERTKNITVVNVDDTGPIWLNQTDTYEVAVDTSNNTTLFTLEASDATADTGDIESNPVTYSHVHNSGDFFSYFTIDQTSGQVKTVAPLVSGINASVVAKATDAAGNYSTKAFNITTPSAANILNEFQSFSTVVTQGTGSGHNDMVADWRVAEIQFENPSAVTGRVIIRGKITANPTYYNDIAVAGWQLLDENGNLVKNFNSLGSYTGGSSSNNIVYDDTFSANSMASIFATYQGVYINEVSEGTAADGKRWHLAHSTASSNTGPQSGYKIGDNQVLDPDTIYPQMANEPYFFVESTSNVAGQCHFLCQTPWFSTAIPQKGSIRIMYFNSGDANTIDGDDTLAVAIGV